MHAADLIFIFRVSPYSTPTAQEGLDALLAAAIFDQRVAVVFMGDGVFQLHNKQSPGSGKNQMKMLQSLAMYDVDRIYVQESALRARGVTTADLAVSATPLSDEEIHRRLSDAAHILSF